MSMLLDKAIANFNNFLMVGRSKATYDYYQFYLERIKKHFNRVNIDEIEIILVTSDKLYRCYY
jgi:hypothetical protein